MLIILRTAIEPIRCAQRQIVGWCGSYIYDADFQLSRASDKTKYNMGVNRNVTVEMKGRELFVTIDENKNPLSDC
jgi:hypothetical protein